MFSLAGKIEIEYLEGIDVDDFGFCVTRASGLGRIINVLMAVEEVAGLEPAQEWKKGAEADMWPVGGVVNAESGGVGYQNVQVATVDQAIGQ